MTRTQKHPPHWPMTPKEFTWCDGSKSIEDTIACPSCGSTNIQLSAPHRWVRKGVCGNVFSPDRDEVQKCLDCGKTSVNGG